MKSKPALILLFIFSIFLPNTSPASSSTSTKDLEKKIEALEKKTSQLEIELQRKDRPGRVATFLAENMSIGGFFEHAITGIFSKDHSYKLAANSNLFALNVAAKMNEKFSFVSQELFFLSAPILSEHDASQRKFSNTPAYGALVAHAYGEYFKSEKFRLQLGLGWSPFGIALANREFPLYLRRNGPQISSAGLPMPYGSWTGAHILGQFDGNLGTLGYDLYSLTSTTNTNRLGGGTRLWWSLPNNNIKIGTSHQILKRDTETVVNLGGDMELKFGRLGLRTEYAQSISEGEDLKTAYAEPYITLAKGKWVIHGEIDYANRPLHSSESPLFATPFKRLQYGGGVNWIPWPFLKARMLVLHNNYIGSSAVAASGETNDFYTIEYSTAIEF